LRAHSPNDLLKNVMLTRRKFLVRSALAATATAIPPMLHAQPTLSFRGLPAALERLEKSCGGRLGVAVVDTGSGEQTGHRANERVAMCSTFKMLLASAVLQRTDQGHEHLERTIPIPAKPLISYSPLTEEHAGSTMTVSDLCYAILPRSDNTAANLLLNTIGGPAGITQFARSIGDTVTRLDRTETSLNEALPGDPRDTTTPSAMLKNMQKLLLGNVLSAASRRQLTEWMIANRTGDEKLRAAIPTGWRVGDKTGSNAETTSNDIAILWPPQRKPILITAYLTECPGPEAKRNHVLSEAGQLVVTALDLREKDAPERILFQQ
jgi:beta-lactamase class A